MKRKIISVLCLVLVLLFPLQSIAYAKNNNVPGKKPVPPDGNGTGLKAEYFDSADLTNLKLTKTDAVIDFNWGQGAPEKNLDAETFSVRWTGSVQPKYSEKYTFHTVSDDGIRLWVDGQKVIDNWTTHSSKEDKGTIELLAGRKYDIKIEYYENTGYETARLFWSSPSQKKEIIPQTQLYPAEISGVPSNITAVATENTLTFGWDVFTDALGYELELDGAQSILDDSTISTFTYENLKPNTNHTFRIRARKAEGSSQWSQPVSKLTLMGPGNGTGLKAEYYDNKDFTNLKVTKTDSQVNFNWDKESPFNSVDPQTYSVRWSGMVQPKFTENYTFYTTSDDGVRLWVNNQLLIDNWTTHSSTENKGSIALTAGEKYNIKLEYYENTGYSVAKLAWSSASQKKEIIPQTQLYPAEIGGIPSNFTSKATETGITLGWDAFPDAAGYEIQVDNGAALIDNATSNTYICPNLQPYSTHTFKVRTKNAKGASDWSALQSVTTLMGPGNGTGLKGEYFDNKDLTGLKITRTDAQVNFDWGTNTPGSAIAKDTFSARWTGYVQPRYTGTYTFYTQSDDGIRMWVNGVKLIDDWTTHSVKENKADISLTAGEKYEIRVEYYENTGYSVAKLLWSTDGLKKEIIPQTQLYPLFTPAVPANISSSSKADSISLTWDSVVGATSYEVEVDGKVLDNKNKTAYVHTGLNSGSKHIYRIRAIADKQPGAWSETVTAFTKLGVPTGISYSQSGKTLTISWDAVSGAEGYELKMAVWVLPTSTNSIMITGLPSSTDYTVEVRAISKEVVGEWSEDKTITTLSDIPEAPKNLSHSETPYSITLSWDAVSGASGYDVQVDNGRIVDVGNNLSFTDTKLAPNSSHVYSVRAKNNFGIGNWSQTASITTQNGLLAIPDNINFSATDTTITLTWDSVGGAVSYDIEEDGAKIENSKTCTFTVKGLEAASIHKFRVRARNAIGPGRWSSEFSGKTNVVEDGAETLFDLKQGIDNPSDGNTYELGTVFMPRVAGEITAIRVFGANGETGKHTARIWRNSDETVIGGPYTIEFTGKGAWYTFKLPVPINVDANTEYTVSVSTGEDSGKIYAVVMDDLRNAGSDGTNLRWPENAGVFTYSVGARPTSSYEGWNFLRDIVFIPLDHALAVPENIKSSADTNAVSLSWDPVAEANGYEIELDGVTTVFTKENKYVHNGLKASSEHTYRIRARYGNLAGQWSSKLSCTTRELPEGVESLFGNAKGIAKTDNPVGYELGTVFQTTVPGEVTAIRVYGVRGEKGEHIATIWRNSDKTIVGQPVTMDFEGNDEWYTYTLPVPVSLDPNTDYTVSVTTADDPGNTYAISADDLSAAGGNEQHLVWPQNSGVFSYNFGVMPTEAYQGWNFLRDIVFVPTDSTVDVPKNITTKPDTNSIALAWDEVEGAIGYDIELDGASLVSTTEAKYVHNGLDSSTSHTYRIRAKIGNVVGQWSTGISSTTTLIPPGTESMFDSIQGEAHTVDGNKYEMGTVFKASTTGEIAAVRIFGAKGESGKHIARIWRNSDNTIIGGPYTFEFTGNDKWITFNIPVAVPIEANVDYTISVSTGEDPSHVYTVASDVLKDAGNNGKDLVWPENSGVFTFELGTRPTESYAGWNFLRDVVFVPSSYTLPTPMNIQGKADFNSITLSWDAIEGASGYEVDLDGQKTVFVQANSYTHNGIKPSSMHKYRVRAKSATATGIWSDYVEYTSTATPFGAESMFGNIKGITNPNDPTGYELGNIFKAKVPGVIASVRVFGALGESGKHYVRIWRNSDNQVIAGPYEVEFTGNNEWFTFDLPDDVQIEANTEYTVSVSTGEDPGKIYSICIDTLKSAGDNGSNLIWPENSGVYTYEFGTRPASVFEGWNFLRDIVFIPLQ